MINHGFKNMVLWSKNIEIMDTRSLKMMYNIVPKFPCTLFVARCHIAFDIANEKRLSIFIFLFSFFSFFFFFVLSLNYFRRNKLLSGEPSSPGLQPGILLGNDLGD